MSDTPLNFRMLRLARELRTPTQTKLARTADIPQARLSRIESGQLTAADTELNALDAALELPSSFLTEPGVPAGRAAVSQACDQVSQTGQRDPGAAQHRGADRPAAA